MGNINVNISCDYLCELRLKDLDSELHKRYCNSIPHLLNILDGYLIHFPNFTDHTILHSVNVVNLCNTLIEKNIEHLNADEIYIILMGIYLHDSGMGISNDDYEVFCQNLNIQNAPKTYTANAKVKFIRTLHHEFSGEFIKKYAASLDIPSAYIFPIVQVSRGHRRIDLYDEKEYPSKYVLPNGNTVCLPYLAALLRLADELDYASDRNSLSMYEKKHEDVYDVKIFKCHQAIQKVSITQDNIAIEVNLKENMDVYEDILRVITKMEQTLFECRDVINKRTSFRLSQKNIMLIEK